MPIAEFDLAVLRFVTHELRADWLTPIMVVVTDLNKNPGVWAAAALAWTWSLLRAPSADRRRRVFWLLLFAASIVASDLVSSHVLKPAVGRVRPFYDHPEIVNLVYGGRLSFPSGHATNAFAAATFLAIATGRAWVAGVGLGLAALVAFSRVYLGVHYPGDVLAGGALGAGVAAGAWRARNPLEALFARAAGRLLGRPPLSKASTPE